MKKWGVSMKKFVLFLVMFFLVSFMYGCGYNKMQANEESVIAAWGDVEAAYQRRADLVPQLMAVVKAYAAHEKDTLTAVTAARSKVGGLQAAERRIIDDPNALREFGSRQNLLGSALTRLLVVVERYPDLKADQNFRNLQYQLEGTENRINVTIVRFNDAVRALNYSLRKFPNNLTNKFLLKLERRKPFKAASGADKMTPVSAMR